MPKSEEIKLKEALALLVEAEEKNFRLYRGREVIGEPVFRALMKRRQGINDNGENYDGFYLTTKDKTVGLMSQLYGLNGLLSLISRFELVPDEESESKTTGKKRTLINNEDKQIIKDGINWVLKYVDDYGYDLSPHIDPEINKQLFLEEDNNTGEKYSYMGARTWGLSLFVAARVAYRKKVIDFSDKEMDEIKKYIKGSIEFFNKSVILSKEVDSKGEPIGWGYADGCENEPSLFFTYSVVEAFADFDDACMDGRDPDLIDFINDGNDSGVKHEEKFRELCFKMGDRAWEIFKSKLKNSFFSDRFDKFVRVIPVEEILASSRSSALFNSLYVIFILFYSYKNNEKVNKKYRPEQSKKENEDVQNAMSLGLQLIQNLFDDLANKGKDSIVERHILAFDQKHRVSKFGKELNDADIQASSLLPMLVKANNLIARHIYQFPQKKMSDLLNRMFMSKLDNEWLWENRRYDLLSTERYLEAIADYFDYYYEYEQHYAQKTLSRAKQEREIKKALKTTVEDSIRKEVKIELKKEHDNALTQKDLEVANRYPIETLLNSRIEEYVNKKVPELLCGALKALSTYNRSDDAGKKQNPLLPFQIDLRDALHDYIESYFYKSLENVARDTKIDIPALKEAGMNSFFDVVTDFLKFVDNNNKKPSVVDRRLPGEMFEIIENYKYIFEMIKNYKFKEYV